MAANDVPGGSCKGLVLTVSGDIFRWEGNMGRVEDVNASANSRAAKIKKRSQAMVQGAMHAP